MSLSLTAEALEKAFTPGTIDQNEPPTRPLDGVWYHGTSATFDRFERRGLGIHFGCKHQALRAPGGSRRIIEVKLSLTNPVRLPDLYSWTPFDVALALEAHLEVDLSSLKLELQQSRTGEEEEDFDRTIKAIQGLGYDGIIYRNIMEGIGDSLMVFHPNKIAIISSKAR